MKDKSPMSDKQNLSLLARTFLSTNPFRNAERQLRNGWWIVIYFLIMAAMLFPLTFWVRQRNGEIEMWHQAILSVVAAIILQRLRRQRLAEMFGEFNLTWCKQLAFGGFVGSVLMLLPALILVIGGWLSLRAATFNGSLLFTGFLGCAAVAIAEEVVFRGVFLQRLRAGLGIVAAQLIVAAYFWLTHSGNPGMEGNVKYLASINIFVASILFGLAYLKTHSLAMPLGLHMMANFVQGSILGFGVSGHNEAGLLHPEFGDSPIWLTGGAFGLEASLPGLITLILLTVYFFRRKSSC